MSREKPPTRKRRRRWLPSQKHPPPTSPELQLDDVVDMIFNPVYGYGRLLQPTDTVGAHVLRDAWPLPVAEETVASDPERPRTKRARNTRGKKLRRGQKTPQKAYVLPILQVLDEMGGRDAVADVLNRVGQIMADKLNEHDRSPLKTGDIRWRNTAQWARHEMKQQGLLRADSPMGIWEITEEGRTYLRKQRK